MIVRFLRLLSVFLPLLCLVVILGGRSSASSKEAGLTQEVVKRSSSAIAITNDGATLLAVNPDSDSISLIDTVDMVVLTEVPVGDNPRTVAVNDAGTRAYTANRAADTISIIDLQSHQVISEIAVGAQPYGVLVSPDGGTLYAAEQGTGVVRFIDPQTLRTTRRVFVGDQPSGLALDESGQMLYVSHLLSSRISLIDASYRFATFLPGFFGSPEYTAVSPNLLNSVQHQRSIDLFQDSNLVQSIVLSPDRTRAYIPHTISNSSNPLLTFESTVIPLVSVIDLEAGIHLTGQHFDLGTLDPPGVGLPFDASVTPDGNELWVLNSASNDITVIDLDSRELSAHIEVGDNPRGIVFSPDGSTAFTNNSLSGTVSVVDTASYSVTQSITATQIPLPPLLLQGKKLFHSSDDPRMSNAQWIACSSCHFDAGHDGRTWRFSFAGPRNTTALLGMIETYPLRWSGEWDESADGEFAIRRENFGSGLIDGEMHCDLFPANCVKPQLNQGLSADLDALAAYMDSLAMPLSPYHRHGEPLSAAEERGREIFWRPELECVTCHPPPLYTDLLPHDVGTATAGELIGPEYDTPTLRGVHSSAPYFHDGSARTLEEALTRSTPGEEHNLDGLLSEQELNDLVRYLMALPYE
jgi:YVTN family beta-propeller protein